MASVAVGILGASGYGGAGLIRRLSRHPEVELVALGSRQYSGQPLAACWPQLAGVADLEFDSNEETIEAAEVVFAATPHGATAPMVKCALDRGRRVIDLSADFRLTPERYAEWYGGPHPHPELYPRARYGLVELHRNDLAGAELVASPGCNATAANLALAPLAAAGWLGPDITITIVTGVSGAGRTVGAGLHFGEVNENARAYKVAGGHRHLAEIEATLGRAATMGKELRTHAPFTTPTVSFTPVLVPMTRGILASCVTRPDDAPNEADLLDHYHHFYRNDPLVRVQTELPHTKATSGSDRAIVTVRRDPRDGSLLALCAIDNLGKGAAGQAVQGFNVAFGFEETLGLDVERIVAMKMPAGFEIAATTAGIKSSGRPDLGLIYSPFPLAWAMMSTENQMKAPCVSRNRARYANEQPIQALAVNSGNANAGNGDQGIWDNEDFAGVVAAGLALPKVQDALTASTGVIGKRFPIEVVREHVADLVQRLGPDSNTFAEAILTTDTRPKQVAATLRNGARVVGIAKGSGMIHPNMATMLAFVMTDASLSQENLRRLWPRIVKRTFNQVSVDGDTSPNDMAILMSSRQLNAEPHEFAEALEAVCRKLAEKIAQDGEGATTLINVRVRGGRDEDQALAAARAIVASNLVKAAVHGRDPNWGRILSAVGSSGAISDMANLQIRLQGQVVYKGKPQPFKEVMLSEMLNASEVMIEVDLAAGDASGMAWGCDLSAEYVKINADYRT